MTLRVELFVRDRLGLDPGSLGPSVLPRAVEHRMRARQVATADAYVGLLTAEPAEQDALAGELVVPETWFFRGGRPLFDRLAEFLAARDPNAPARALSVPCSTGEEPYSLAIALHERLVPPGRFEIDAVDLAPGHLGRAAEGRFPAFAFREAGTDIRLHHFRHADDRWELLPGLRGLVRFRPGNATDPTFLAGERPYDLILCRNLFIYLTPAARRQAVANLDRLLARDGWLGLSPGEADRLPAGRFVAEGPPEFGIYRRVGIGSKLHAALDALRPAEPRAVPPTIPSPQVMTPDATPQAAAAAGPLEFAQSLADAGRLPEARAACEQAVREAASSDAYALLGVIHQAEGRTAEAAEAFRRALYLAPDHAGALAHMIVLCDRRGDAAQADALRRRLARATREDAT